MPGGPVVGYSTVDVVSPAVDDSRKSGVKVMIFIGSGLEFCYEQMGSLGALTS